MGDVPDGISRSGPWNAERVEQFLAETCIPLRLAWHGPSGFPVVASLWFLHRDAALWCATRPDAAVARHLRRDGRCAFEVAPDQPPYRGVRGAATATVDPAGGKALLEELLIRYTGGLDSSLARGLLARADDEVVLRLEPTRLTSWDYRERMADA